MAQDEVSVLRQRRDARCSRRCDLRHFRRLWVADMVSLLGDWAGRLALTVLVLERTGSPAWAAAVTAVSLAGFVGIGQVLATFADRYGRIAVMLAADVARAGAVRWPCCSPSPSACCSCSPSSPVSPPSVRGGPLRRAARPRPRGPLRRRARARRHVGAVSLVIGYALGGLLLTVVDPEVGPRHQRVQLPRVRRCCSSACATRAAARPASVRSTVGRSLGDGAAVALRRPDGAPCPRDRRRHRRTGHGGRGPRRALRGPRRLPDGLARPARRRRSPSARWSATAVIAGGTARPPRAPAQRRLVRGDHLRGWRPRCSGSRRAAPSPSSPSPSPAACSRCRSPPTP